MTSNVSPTVFDQVLWNTGTSVFYYIQDNVEAALLGSQVATIVTLTKGCKNATIVRELADIPAGCGAAVVTPTVAVHVLVKVSMMCGQRSDEKLRRRPGSR